MRLSDFTIGFGFTYQGEVWTCIDIGKYCVVAVRTYAVPGAQNEAIIRDFYKCEVAVDGKPAQQTQSKEVRIYTALEHRVQRLEELISALVSVNPRWTWPLGYAFTNTMFKREE